jgi:chemotaxis signal transduction protein
VSAEPIARGQRWLTFEIGSAAYALPIGDVLEVSEVGHIGRVPSLPRSVGGVMHYHGDALPIVARSALFDVDLEELGEPEHVLVIADRGGDVPRLGLPVDRVLGLADAPPPGALEPAAARLPIEGRDADILDIEWLVSRAAEVIARAGGANSNDPEHGGEI